MRQTAQKHPGDSKSPERMQMGFSADIASALLENQDADPSCERVPGGSAIARRHAITGELVAGVRGRPERVAVQPVTPVVSARDVRCLRFRSL